MNKHFSDDPNINKICNEQLEYFVNRFSGQSNPIVLEARGEALIKKNLHKWDKKSGNLKTFLNKQLQPLYRESIKAQAVYVPEGTQQQLSQSRRIIDEFELTHNRKPDVKELAKEMNISEKKAKELLYMQEGTTHASFDDTLYTNQLQTKVSHKNLINTIDDELHRNIATDLYINNKSPQQIMDKYKFKSTKYYEVKNKIDNHISDYAEYLNSY